MLLSPSLSPQHLGVRARGTADPKKAEWELASLPSRSSYGDMQEGGQGVSPGLEPPGCRERGPRQEGLRQEESQLRGPGTRESPWRNQPCRARSQQDHEGKTGSLRRPLVVVCFVAAGTHAGPRRSQNQGLTLNESQEAGLGAR